MLDREILAGFQTESLALLAELERVVESLEEAQGRFPAQELEQFAQRIDRIMGAAQTLNQVDPGHRGLQRIGAITSLCKTLGYKAVEFKLAVLVPIFAAFWSDTLEVLAELIQSAGDEAKSRALAEAFASTVQNRLKWLSEKVQQLAPSQQQALDQSQVDELLTRLKGK